MSQLFDDLPSDSLAELYEILSRREPKILGIIQSGGDLIPTERERVDNAVIAESILVMGPNFEQTPEQKRVVELLYATREVVPLRTEELPNRGKWKKGDPITGDPYGDGGAASGYGPQPTAGA